MRKWRYVPPPISIGLFKHRRKPVDLAAPVELRSITVTNGRLSGVAMVYDQKARDRPERFSPGAFTTGLNTAALNLQHDRDIELAAPPDTLQWFDTPTELRLEARLKPGSAGLALLERKALNALSVEFVSRRERRVRGVRVIDEAALVGVGLVDVSSYPTRVEVRQDIPQWLTASIRTNLELTCSCQGPETRQVIFAPFAFLWGSDVLAFGGSRFSQALGSLRRETLVLDQDEDGLHIGLTAETAGTIAATELTESSRVSTVVARPILDMEKSDYVDVGDVRRFNEAYVRAVTIRAVPADEAAGIEPVEIVGEVTVRNRRRVWL